jgi:tetratricopeptide (TPR) repeat protein
MRYYQYAFLILGILISSCARPRMSVPVMRPADVTIDREIHRIALINRTAPENEMHNILEGVLSGETIGQDARGVDATYNGLLSVFNNSNRYEVVKTDEHLKTPTQVLTKMPDKLSWYQVTNLCKKYDADALLSVEVFDSDFIITDGVKEVVRKDENGREYKTRKYVAKGVATVKIGIRLYDPHKKVIQDEMFVSRDMSWDASGKSPKDAIAHLVSRSDAVSRVSYQAGRTYGSRITPVLIRVIRRYYDRPKKAQYLVQGARYAKVSDWEGAHDAWMKALNNPDFKIAGRACYNLAMIYEIWGELDKAKEYAQRSYTEFGNKDARDYVYALERRIYQAEKLKGQM